MLAPARRQAHFGYAREARPPYTEWSWKSLDTRVGGPHMVQLPDGRIVAAGRDYVGEARDTTVVARSEKTFTGGDPDTSVRGRYQLSGTGLA